MTIRTCSVCGIQESNVGQQVKIVEVNGMSYCEEHAPKTQEIPVKEATQEQKITALTETVLLLKKGQDQQNEYLKSIKGSLTFFVIIVIFGIFVQLITSCGL